jgi:ASC-1-like (ASCH) protein
MKNLEEVVFYIPKAIMEGLKCGKYERVGGIIRHSSDKKIVLWLSESGKPLAGTQKIVMNVSNLGKISLAFADYFYMQTQFNDIKNALKSIELKINAQNISKVQSGLKLAIEAEKMNDRVLAISQLSNARQLLEEGSQIFQHLFYEARNRDKQNKFISFSFLRLVLLCEMGTIRSYLANSEFDLAIMRLLQVQILASNIGIDYLRRSCETDWEWWVWPLLPLIIPIGLIMLISGKKTKEDELTEQINLLERNSKNQQGNFQLVYKKAIKKEIEIACEIQSLMTFCDNIDGYLFEVRKCKENKINILEDNFKDLLIS